MFKNQTSRGSFWSLIALGLVAVGCTKPESSAEKSGIDKPAVPAATQSAPTTGVSAKQVFAERCSACHGPSGKGDGPASAALNPKPRNYGDKAWQASVTDEQIRKTIIYGGAAVGKSPVMPSSPDLDGKPEVVDGLVKMVRAFGGM